MLLLTIDTLIQNNKINNYKDIIFKSSLNYHNINTKFYRILGIKKDLYVNKEIMNYKNYKYVNNLNYFEFEEETTLKSIKEGTVTEISSNKDGDRYLTIESNEYKIKYIQIDNISVNLYDHVNQNEIIGTTTDNKIIIEIKENNKNIKYEDIN